MDNIDLILLLLLGGGIALFLIAVLVKYLMGFYSDIKYVKMEMGRAYDWDEYVYWRRELRALRWCIIPGLTVERVKAIKKFFYRGKYAKKHEKSDGFMSMLLPSILGICICAICLVGGTFAWFTATKTTGTANIQAASYTVATEISAEDGTLIATGNSVTLQEGSYTVKLTATGDAKTGYCVLDFAGAKAYTKQIAKGDSITIALTVNEPVMLKITAVWGTYAGDDKVTEYIYGKAEEAPLADDKDDNAEQLDDTPEDTATEETTATETEPTLDPTQYTVKSGDSLSKIAALYGKSVKRLQAYNNIENPSQIYAGQVIKIPPAGWEIPETTTTEETTSPPITEPTETTSQTEATTEPDETTTVPEETTGTTEAQSESEGNE